MRAFAILLIVLGLIASATGASAHASLVASEPADGAILRAPPASVVLRFNEPVSPLAFKLIDAAGGAHDRLNAVPSGETITITPPAELPKGTQTLSYRIVSADGHPVGGVVAFSIGMPGGASVARSEGDRWRVGAIWALRLLQLSGLIAGVGGVYFLAWVAPAAATRPLSRQIGAMLALGGLAACMAIGSQGLDLLDLPLPALATAPPALAACSVLPSRWLSRPRSLARVLSRRVDLGGGGFWPGFRWRCWRDRSQARDTRPPPGPNG